MVTKTKGSTTSALKKKSTAKKAASSGGRKPAASTAGKSTRRTSASPAGKKPAARTGTVAKTSTGKGSTTSSKPSVTAGKSSAKRTVTKKTAAKKAATRETATGQSPVKKTTGKKTTVKAGTTKKAGAQTPKRKPATKRATAKNSVAGTKSPTKPRAASKSSVPASGDLQQKDLQDITVACAIKPDQKKESIDSESVLDNSAAETVDQHVTGEAEITGTSLTDHDSTIEAADADAQRSENGDMQSEVATGPADSGSDDKSVESPTDKPDDQNSAESNGSFVVLLDDEPDTEVAEKEEDTGTSDSESFLILFDDEDPEDLTEIDQTESGYKITLAGDISFNNIVKLKSRLESTLDAVAIEIDASGLEGMDTASIQMLLSYTNNLRNASVPVKWTGTSKTFDSVSTTLGVSLVE